MMSRGSHFMAAGLDAELFAPVTRTLPTRVIGFAFAVTINGDIDTLRSQSVTSGREDPGQQGKQKC